MTSRRSLILGLVATVGAASIAVAGREQATGLARIAAACAACHGAAGEGNEARSAPKLAGLDAGYMADELRKFRTGARGDASDDRYGSQMRAVARTLKDEDLKALTALLASMPERTPVRTVAGNVANGRALYETCASCHGGKGEGGAVPGAPRLAYQPDWYLVTALDTFRRDARGYAAGDVEGAQMAAMAKALPDDRAVRDVAAYIATLRPPVTGGRRTR